MKKRSRRVALRRVRVARRLGSDAGEPIRRLTVRRRRAERGERGAVGTDGTVRGEVRARGSPRSAVFFFFGAAARAPSAPPRVCVRARAAGPVTRASPFRGRGGRSRVASVSFARAEPDRGPLVFRRSRLHEWFRATFGHGAFVSVRLFRSIFAPRVFFFGRADVGGSRTVAVFGRARAPRAGGRGELGGGEGTRGGALGRVIVRERLGSVETRLGGVIRWRLAASTRAGMRQVSGRVGPMRLGRSVGRGVARRGRILRRALVALGPAPSRCRAARFECRAHGGAPSRARVSAPSPVDDKRNVGAFFACPEARPGDGRSPPIAAVFPCQFVAATIVRPRPRGREFVTC